MHAGPSLQETSNLTKQACQAQPNGFIVLPMREMGAGIVVIGNEILSGKTVDSNSAFLARELRQLGVTLQQITVIPDELDVIAETVRDFHRKFDIVFTSGGVGPTHDDITIEGVPRALGRQVIVHP